MLTKIYMNQSQSQLIQSFLKTSGNSGIGRSIFFTEILLDHHVSMVGVTQDKNIVIKLIKARTWHEHVKIFWKRSRTHTEFTGAKLLRSIGIDAPDVYEMGISFPIPRNALFIGYYLMENLAHTGYIPLSDLQFQLDKSQITRLTHNIREAMERLYLHKVLYSDLHLDNIFCHPDSLKLKFIDTGAKKYIRHNVYRRKQKKAIWNLVRSIRTSEFSGTKLDEYCEELHSMAGQGFKNA